MCALDAAVRAAKWRSSAFHWLAGAGGLARMRLAIGCAALTVGRADASVSHGYQITEP